MVQMLMGEEPSPAADIYSFGVVLWEICCQEMPQRGRRRDPTPAEAPLVRAASNVTAHAQSPRLKSAASGWRQPSFTASIGRC